MEKRKKGNFETIREQLESILATKEAQIKEYEDVIAMAEKDIEQATLEAGAAYRELNNEAYKAANDRIQEKENIVSMYSSKIEEMRQEPYISQEEYKEIVSDITSYMDKCIEDKLGDYQKHIEALLSMKNDISEKVVETNALLSITQRKLLKDPCGKILPNGRFIEEPWTEIKYKNTLLLRVLFEILVNKYNYDYLISIGHTKEEITNY